MNEPQNPTAGAAEAGATIEPVKSPAPKAVKRKRWPKMVLGVLVFLILVGVLAPTLLSTGPGKSMVLGVVNKQINGSVEVADWSLGWTSGVAVTGLRVLDEKGEVIVKAQKATSELSLLKALTGGFKSFDLGKTEIEGLDLARVHVDERGQLNVAKLAKSSDEKKKAGEPIKIAGDIRIIGMTGRISAEGVTEVLRIHPSNLSLTIRGLDQAIAHDIKLVFAVENGPPVVTSGARYGAEAPTGAAAFLGTKAGTITLVGEADPQKFQFKEKLVLAGVDMSALNPLFAIGAEPGEARMQVAGIADGTYDVTAIGAVNAGAEGLLTIADFKFTSPAMNGDTFVSKSVRIPLKIARIAENQDPNVLKVGWLRMETDYGAIGMVGNISQESLERLAKGESPGREGLMTISADFDKAAELINSMPLLFHLEKGVTVQTARLFTESNIWLTKEKIVTKSRLSLANVTGTRTVIDPATKVESAQTITLAPIDQTFDATYIPTGSAAPTAGGNFRDLAYVFSSSFANITGKTGPDGSLASFKMTGGADLGKLREQIAQFVAMEGVKLSGMLALSVETKGDPSGKIFTPDIRVEVTQPVVYQSAAAVKPVAQAVGEKPVTPAAGATAAPVAAAPFQIESGVLALSATIATEGKVTSLRAGTFNVTKLKLNHYDQKDRKIHLKFAAMKQGGEASEQRLEITELAGDLDVAKVNLTKPIALSGMGTAKFMATGGIQLTAKLAEALRVLEAFAGAEAGTKYPYEGDLVLAQELTTNSGIVRLTGSAKIAGFRAYEVADKARKTPTFSEEMLVLANDVAIDPATDTATVHSVSFETQSTGAIMFSLANGTLSDWSNNRKIQGKIQALVKIDWAKAWVLIKPLLDAETAEDLKDLVASGRMERTYEISGSFPRTGTDRRGRVVTLPIQNSLRFLVAEGGITIPRIYAMGMEMENLNIPIFLEKGIVYIADHTDGKTLRPPTPISCNGGQIDLGADIRLDLNQPDPKRPGAIVPLLTFGKANWRLFKDVRITPALARTTLGKYINTAFSEAQKANGLMNITIAYCEALPLGARAKEATATGRAKFEMAMSAVEIQSGGLGVLGTAVSFLASKAPGGGAAKGAAFDSISGSIEKSTVTIEKGRIIHDLNLRTDRLGDWQFDGNLTLSNREYELLRVRIPTGIIPMPDAVRKYLPPTVTMTFTGPIAKPQLSGKFVEDLFKDALLKGGINNLLEGLGGGNKKPRN